MNKVSMGSKYKFTPNKNPIPTNVHGQYIWLNISGIEVIEIVDYH